MGRVKNSISSRRISSLEFSNNLDSLVMKATKYFGAEIPKGKYIGNGRAHDCDKNSFKHRKDTVVYRGVLIIPNRDYQDKYIMIKHIFNVENGKVVEHTNLALSEDEWMRTAHYFGVPYKGTLKNVFDY